MDLRLLGCDWLGRCLARHRGSLLEGHSVLPLQGSCLLLNCIRLQSHLPLHGVYLLLVCRYLGLSRAQSGLLRLLQLLLLLNLLLLLLLQGGLSLCFDLHELLLLLENLLLELHLELRVNGASPLGLLLGAGRGLHRGCDGVGRCALLLWLAELRRVRIERRLRCHLLRRLPHWLLGG